MLPLRGQRLSFAGACWLEFPIRHTAFNKEAYTIGEILPNSGFLYITVHPEDVKVEYIRSYFMKNSELNEDATKTFTYTIKK